MTEKEWREFQEWEREQELKQLEYIRSKPVKTESDRNSEEYLLRKLNNGRLPGESDWHYFWYRYMMNIDILGLFPCMMVCYILAALFAFAYASFCCIPEYAQADSMLRLGVMVGPWIMTFVWLNLKSLWRTIFKKELLCDLE